MIPWPAVILAALAGYAVGSIPTGFLIGRAFGVDPRSHGSGKMGATNVHRVLGRKASLAVLACDMAKGAAAVAIARFAFGGAVPAEVAAGLAAIIGHVFPVFIGFRGGRGVATAVGAMLVISPLVGVAALVAGSVIIAIFRMASLGSLLGASAGLLVLVILFASQQQPFAVLVYGLLAVFILAITHRDNIQRLATGTERKIQL
jgi:glycerol-3-phosphate acyltransferase PlsY